MVIHRRADNVLCLETGKKVELLSTFERVLELQEVFRDRSLLPYDKDRAAKVLLFGGARLTKPEFKEAFLLACNVLFPQKPYDGPRAFDLQQDAALIYAAFWQTYGIDLHRVEGLSWESFVALLGGLPSNTRFMEVVQIRLKPLPKPTKHNQEEIRKLMEAKAKYRIRLTEEEEKNQFQAGLQRLAQSLMKGG